MQHAAPDLIAPDALTPGLVSPDPHSAEAALEQSLFESMATGIEKQGYVILPAALPEPLCGSLVDYLAALERSQFHPAGTGRGKKGNRNPFVRRDHIFWIDDAHPESEQWLSWTTRLRLYLNRRLLLGLFSFESHFSIYEPGDFYRRHVDAFKGESNRVLSIVVYLNRGWEPDQGGELQLFEPGTNADLVRIVPAYGTIVLFLSEEFPHEVLPTRRERYAVAGWYRVNTSWKPES